MDDKRRPGIWLWISLVVVVYVLSVGPAARIANWSSGQADRFMEVFYYPLIWLHAHTFLRGPLEAYVDLWSR